MDETPPPRGGSTFVLLAVTAIVVLLGTLVSVVPGLAPRSEYAAARFVDRSAYAQRVLNGMPMPHAPHLPLALEPLSTGTVLYGIGAVLLALALAALSLRPRLRPRVLAQPVAILKALHSGIVGDYVMWITVGTVVIGGIWAVTLR
jgi:multicomponent Na+:H+ antiporter subunit D